MVLHGSSLAVELIVNNPRGKLGVGMVETVGDRPSESKALGRWWWIRMEQWRGGGNG